MKNLLLFFTLFLMSNISYAGGQPITLTELAGKWQITKFTGSNGNVIPLGDSAYYIFTMNGDFIEEMDGSQTKRQYFIKDSKLMIKGPIAGLNFEWDVTAKDSNNLTLKTSNNELIELRK